MYYTMEMPLVEFDHVTTLMAGPFNTAAKRLRMLQVEHFRSLLTVSISVTLSSQIKVSRAFSASFCVQLVVQLFCFMLLVFLTIL